MAFRIESLNGQLVAVRIIPADDSKAPQSQHTRCKQQRNRYHTGGRVPSGIKAGWRL